jgi:hypothetical protein
MKKTTALNKTSKRTTKTDKYSFQLSQLEQVASLLLKKPEFPSEPICWHSEQRSPPYPNGNKKNGEK